MVVPETRSVSEGADGRVVVRRSGTLSPRKKRLVLADVGDGTHPAKAVRKVGVSPQVLARELRSDAVFAAGMADAIEGYKIVVEGELDEHARVGTVRESFARSGELTRREHVVDTKALLALVGAHNPMYKAAAAQTNVVVIQPLSSAELERLRDVGRDRVDVIDELSESAAEAEWDADRKRLSAGGGS